MQSEPGAAFLRGAAPPALPDGRIVARAAFLAGVLALAVLVALLTAEAIAHRHRVTQLRSAGVAVEATVTGCVGNATGTGITVSFFTCTATFSTDGADGTTHTAVVHGSSRLLAPGTALAAVVDPRDPSTLSTPGAVSGDWTAFVPAAATFAVLVGLLLGGQLVRRRPIQPGRSQSYWRESTAPLSPAATVTSPAEAERT